MASPSAWETWTTRIVIDGSLPVGSLGSPGALVTRITAVAPAACAFLAFCTNVHDPRSTSAIAPAGKPTSGPQPSVGFALPSDTSTTFPDRPSSEGSGPNVAPAASYLPAAEEGASIV